MNDITKRTKEDLDSIAEESLEPLAEALVEAVLKADILDSIPVLKTIKACGKAIFAATEVLFAKRLNRLAKVLKADPEALKKFEQLSDKEKTRVSEIIFSEIEKQTNELQAEAQAHLLRAYLKRQLTYDEFAAISHELKNLNPIIFNKQYVDLVLVSDNQIHGYGSEYLPVVFCHDISTTNGSILISGMPTMTSLGVIFYYHVWTVMAK